MIVKCPKCDSENLAPIYYGIQPDNNEIRKLIDDNKIIYGGTLCLMTSRTKIMAVRNADTDGR